MLTDTVETDDIFKRAALEKSCNKLKSLTQCGLDVRSTLQNIECYVQPESTIRRRRNDKVRTKEMIKFRAHNFE